MVPGGGTALNRPSPWSIERRAGGAAVLHGFEPPSAAKPTLVLAEIDQAALVLGSTQPDRLVDAAAAHAAGLDVVRRRSGGGAVLLVPGDHVWIDVWIPAGHPAWVDDVAAAAIPIGHAWADALAAAGIVGTVHRDGASRDAIDRLVCFAGRGPGEVFDRWSRKLVGVSQRRTRDWIRLQTMLHRHWDPVRTMAGFDLDPDDRASIEAEIGERVATVELDGETAVSGLAASLG